MLYIKDEVEAQEIVQQIFVRFWEYRKQLAAVKHLHDYFFIATRNRVFDHLHQLARTQKALSALKTQMTYLSSEDSTTQFVQHKDYRNVLATAVSQLPPQQKQVYRMAEEEALDLDEIAGRLQLSRNTVKKHLELARRSVRQYVKHFLQHDCINVLWIALIRFFL